MSLSVSVISEAPKLIVQPVGDLTRKIKELGGPSSYKPVTPEQLPFKNPLEEQGQMLIDFDIEKSVSEHSSQEEVAKVLSVSAKKRSPADITGAAIYD